MSKERKECIDKIHVKLQESLGEISDLEESESLKLALKQFQEQDFFYDEQDSIGNFLVELFPDKDSFTRVAIGEVLEILKGDDEITVSHIGDVNQEMEKAERKILQEDESLKARPGALERLLNDEDLTQGKILEYKNELVREIRASALKIINENLELEESKLESPEQSHITQQGVGLSRKRPIEDRVEEGKQEHNLNPNKKAKGEYGERDRTPSPKPKTSKQQDSPVSLNEQVAEILAASLGIPVEKARMIHIPPDISLEPKALENSANKLGIEFKMMQVASPLLKNKSSTQGIGFGN